MIKIKLKTIISALCLLTLARANSQTIVINEFMSNNVSTIEDTYEDYSDWIEIYNTTNSAINLEGYSLSDDSEDLFKWQFPNITINAHDFLIVYASKKNTVTTENEIHTNFKISASGEELFLSNPSEMIIDQTESIALIGDESYLRTTDGANQWAKTQEPSPSASNNNSDYFIFSHYEGMYDTPIDLSITSSNNHIIRYTTDGSLPNNTSPILESTIHLEDKSSSPNIYSSIQTAPTNINNPDVIWSPTNVTVDKANIIRCASFNNGIITSKVYTKTYFIKDNIHDYYTLPLLSLVTEPDNLFDDENGIYVPGNDFDENDPSWTGNYYNSGINWEKDVHIEHYSKDGELNLAQDAGMRIHGGASRALPQKTLRFYARQEYGQKYFNHKLLPNRDGIKKYKRFIIKTPLASWYDPCILNDHIAQLASKQLNIDYQEIQPVIVFINGEYWGIQTICDRIDERYIEYTHNIDKDSVEQINYKYFQLINYIENNDLSIESNYQYVSEKIDISNFIDYTIAETYFSNYDWPQNNLKAWRKKDTGKWRYIFYDIDAGMYNENYNMFDHIFANDPSVTWPNPPESTIIFRKLFENSTFKNQFLDRYAYVLNNILSYNNISNTADSIKSLYAPEMLKHCERWNHPIDVDTWENSYFSNVEHFLIERPCVLKQQIIDKFELSEFAFDCHNSINDSDYFKLSVYPNPSDGYFTVELGNQYIENGKLSILSVLNTTIYSIDHLNIKPNEIRSFNINSIPPGNYIIMIKDKKRQFIQKLIITK